MAQLWQSPGKFGVLLVWMDVHGRTACARSSGLHRSGAEPHIRRRAAISGFQVPLPAFPWTGGVLQGWPYLKRKASKLLLRSDKSMAGSDKGNFSWFYLSYFWAGTA